MAVNHSQGDEAPRKDRLNSEPSSIRCDASGSSPSDTLQIVPHGRWILVSNGKVKILFPPIKTTQFVFRFPRPKPKKDRWLLRVFPNIETAFDFVKCNYLHCDSYFRTSEFFAPKELGRKRNNKTGANRGAHNWACNRFYQCIFPLDFDLKNIPQDEVMKIVNQHAEYLRKTYGAKDLLIVKTFRGFHLDWLSFWDDYAEKEIDNIWGTATQGVKQKDGTVIEVPYLSYPGNMEDCAYKIKTRIVKKFRDDGYCYLKTFKRRGRTWQKVSVLFDAPISRDTRRIVRLPGGFHTGGQIVCEFNFHIPTDTPKGGESSLEVPADGGKETACRGAMMTEAHPVKAMGEIPIEAHRAGFLAIGTLRKVGTLCAAPPLGGA